MTNSIETIGYGKHYVNSKSRLSTENILRRSKEKNTKFIPFTEKTELPKNICNNGKAGL
jgi:hypothetical protein